MKRAKHTHPGKSTPHPFLLFFGRVWALWGLLLFIATMFPALVFYLPCFLLPEPAKARWHRHVSRVWMFFYLGGIGCPLRLYGKKNVPQKGALVVVCNHNSLMDVPVSTPFMLRANKTIAKKSFSRVPFFGWIYRFGSVLVDRDSDASRRKSMEDMKQVIRSGLDMVIYPEGTRNRTGEPLKRFYDGAFRLSIDTHAPVLPVVLFYTKDVLPPAHTFYMVPHHLEMHFLPPVYPAGHTTESLKKEVFQKMWDYYLHPDLRQ